MFETTTQPNMDGMGNDFSFLLPTKKPHGTDAMVKHKYSWSRGHYLSLLSFDWFPEVKNVLPLVIFVNVYIYITIYIPEINENWCLGDSFLLGRCYVSRREGAVPEREHNHTKLAFILQHWNAPRNCCKIHPRKLTCPLKRTYFNRKYIFQPLIFRGHVGFLGSKLMPYFKTYLVEYITGVISVGVYPTSCNIRFDVPTNFL